VTAVNIDMIGRTKKKGRYESRQCIALDRNEIYVIGSKMMSTELGELTETVNKSFLNLTFNYRYDDPKDPPFFFRTTTSTMRAGHSDSVLFGWRFTRTIQARDESHKIDYENMET